MKAKRGSSKARALVRGEPVVRGILDATVAELADVGYGALRIEDVAARAGVNKTTVYRRWPTKLDLVQAALRSITVDRAIAPNTGSFRGDLLFVARNMAEVMGSAAGQSIRRMLIAEERNPEFNIVSQSLRDSLEAFPRPLIDAAIARGEIAKSVDAPLILSVLAGAMEHRIFSERKEVDDGFFTQVVDMLLFGALSSDRPAPKALAERRDG